MNLKAFLNFWIQLFLHWQRFPVKVLERVTSSSQRIVDHFAYVTNFSGKIQLSNQEDGHKIRKK
jgi:hypothetical protein